MNRKSFPIRGIFAVQGGISSTYYLKPEHAKRYRYIRPAQYAHRSHHIADCWIVDKQGKVNPGTNVSPVPFCKEAVGRRVA
jgi:hypothetical protein